MQTGSNGIGAGVPAAVIADAVTAARQFLRAGDDAHGAGEDAVIARAAGTAFALAEAFIGAVPVAVACEDVVAADGTWQRLGRAPVTDIAGGVTAMPVTGGALVLPVEAYAVDIDGGGQGWVRVGARADVRRVTVRYTAGMAADWAGVPMPIAQGIVMLIAHLVDDRAGGASPPAAVAALWRPWRRMAVRPAPPVVRSSGLAVPA